MGSKNTSVPVVAVSASIMTGIMWLVGYYEPGLMEALPHGGEGAIIGGLAVVISWLTPDPND